MCDAGSFHAFGGLDAAGWTALLRVAVVAATRRRKLQKARRAHGARRGSGFLGLRGVAGFFTRVDGARVPAVRFGTAARWLASWRGNVG